MMSDYNFVNTEVEGKFFKLKYYSYFDEYYTNNCSYVEPETKKWFLENLKENDIIFDIGAHIGLFTIIFAQKTKKVFSFEPTSTFEFLLLPNLKENNIQVTSVEKLAFGNQTGNIEEKIFRIWGKDAEVSNYDFMTLDQYIYEKKIFPKYLKIDVDSFELEVLFGGKKFLKEFNPIVCVECNQALKKRNYDTVELQKFMSDSGYEILTILDKENFIYIKNGVNN